MTLSPRALSRRAKTYLRQRSLELYMPVLPGFEHVARRELEALGRPATVVRGGLAFQGNLASIYEVNLAHRTGSRVLLRLGDFLAQNYPMLYDHTRKIPWEVVLGNCPSVNIEASFRNSRLRNRDHLEAVTFAGITARLEALGLQTLKSKQGHLTVQARLFRDRCTLSLDTSGEHLHKRGYRSETVNAPLRETSAAALLLLAEAAKYDVIVDPFCGSGTIPIEADLLTRNCPPGALRDFAITSSPLHSPGTLADVRRRLLARCQPLSGRRILGYDVDDVAVAASRSNAKAAAAATVSFERANAMSLDLDGLLAHGERGLVATNVPYGVRVGTKDQAQQLLDGLVHRLAAGSRSWDFAIVAPADAPLAMERVTLKERYPFRNGRIPVQAIIGSTNRH